MPPLQVLIVDDQPDVRRMLRAALETLDIPLQITDVPSGEEAILVTSNHPVDLMIADVRLPGISGLELIKRARVRNPQLRLVLVTGMTDERVRAQVETAQADAFFYKPIPMSDFLERTRTLLVVDGTSVSPQISPAPAAAEVESLEPEGLATSGLQPVGPLDVTLFKPQALPSPQQRIQARINELRQQQKAEQVVLINLRRDILAHDGILPVGDDSWETALDAAVGFAPSPAAGLKAIVYFSGKAGDFLIVRVTPEAVLLVGASHGAWETSGLGKTAAVLAAAVTDICAAGLAGGRIPTGKTGPLKAALEDESDFPDLDSLFEILDRGAGERGDPDAFWEHAAEDHPEHSGRSGALTFDEAQRLGLAPEDD